MYLIDRYGEDAVWSLLRNDASSWDEAVEEELGVTETGLERNWYRWAEESIEGDFSDRIESQNTEARIDELQERLEEKERKIKIVKTSFIATLATFAGILIVLHYLSVSTCPS